MKILLSILLFFLFISYQLEQQYPLKNERPTKDGITYYVKTNEEKLIKEYQEFVKDTLYDVYLSVDDLSKYSDDNSILGFCISSPGYSEIIITNEEKYIGYEVELLSKYQRQKIIEANNFVKATIFHELTHYYFNQVIREMKMDSMNVNPDYTLKFSIIPKGMFGSKFIEEGVCEYVVTKKGEQIILDNYIPKTTDEILNSSNQYNILYKYSAVYLKSFMDYYGIKKSIQILVSNSPPTQEEILFPSKFFGRLKID